MSSQSTSLTSRLLDTSCGVLLVGHGTRNTLGQDEFLQVGEMLRLRLRGVPVQTCFLELASPDISAGVDALAKAGARQIIVAPLLLFAAGHAKRDIPAAIARAVGQHDGLAWRMAEPLGDHPALLCLSAKRFTATLNNTPEATWLFVGRGSSDAEAIQSVHAFAERRRRMTPVAASQVGFLAAARPTFHESIRWAIAQSPRNIIIQPHLLFHGQLIQDIAAETETARKQTGKSKIWSIAQHLGPTTEVIDAALDRIQQTLD